MNRTTSLRCRAAAAQKKTDVSWRIGPPHHVHVIILIQPKYGGALLPARDCDPPTRFHGDERSFATTSVTLLAPDEQAIPGVRQEPGGEGARTYWVCGAESLALRRRVSCGATSVTNPAATNPAADITTRPGRN